MRLLIVADLHYSLKQFDWLVARAGEYDGVIIAGDLLDIAGHATLDTQIVVASRYLSRLALETTLIVSSGNHDGDEQIDDGEYIAAWLAGVSSRSLHRDGGAVWYGTSLVTICPWVDGDHSRRALDRLLEAHGGLDKERWLWVHHAPPNDARVCWTGKRFFGDGALNDLIARYAPDAVISGHVHYSPFRAEGCWCDRVGSTWVFNPGRQLAPSPAFIELDLDAWTARWISEMDVQRIDLNDAAAEPASSPGTDSGRSVLDQGSSGRAR